MNILIVSSEYPPESPGGLGNAVRNLALGLSAAGARPIVLSSVRPGASGGLDGRRCDEIDGTVPVIRIRMDEKRLRREPAWFWRFHPYHIPLDCLTHSRSLAAACREIVASEAIDVVQFSDYRAEGFAFIGRSHSIPCVVRLATPLYIVHRINDALGFSRTRPEGRHERAAIAIVRMLEQKPIREAAAIASPSRDLARIIEADIRPKGRVRVIPTGIDLEHFSKRPAAETARLAQSLAPGGERIVLFTGRYEYRKGVHDLVEAFGAAANDVPDARLVCAGGDTETAPDGGSMKAYLSRLIIALGLERRVVLLDRVPYRTLPLLYSLATVYAAPALYENLANTVLEAMACGLPVITTTAGGAGEVLDDPANGMLVPPGDRRALAAAILGLLADPKRCTMIGAANEHAARGRFSRERMARDFLSLYNDIL